MEHDAPRVGEAPFDSGRKMMSTLHQAGEKILQFTKGAPDEVLKRCAWVEEQGRRVKLTEERRREILAANKAMAGRALRVLCAACRVGSAPRRYESRQFGAGFDVLRPGRYDRSGAS